MKNNFNSLIKSSIKDTRTLFTGIMLLEFFLMLAILFISHGSLIGWFFFHDKADTGMDFFNEIFSFNTSSHYPPLAKLFDLALHRSVEEIWPAFPDNTSGTALRRSYYDIRTYQHTLLLFILFLASFAVFFALLIEAYLKKYPGANLFAIACCLTYGVLYAVERGNLILLSLLFSFAFLAGYDSHNSVIRELSLLSLAIAANLKFYPALLGLLLLREKKWKLSIRTLLYGILFFLLPMMRFGGIKAIESIIKSVSNRFDNNPYGITGLYGLSDIYEVLTSWLKDFAGITSSGSTLLSIVKTAAAAILIAGVCLSKKRWEQCLYIVTAMLLLQHSCPYHLCFYLLPFLMLCKEEPVGSSSHAAAAEKVCMIVLLSIVPRIPLYTDRFNLSFVIVNLTQLTVLAICAGVVRKALSVKRTAE